jgi:probable F420-dependent oxidoreductase
MLAPAGQSTPPVLSQNSMKFGIVLPNFGPGASRLTILDTALACESLGYDSVWVTDHLALPKEDADRFGHIFESITTLSYLAASTSQIRLGISTLVLPQRNPLEVAKQVATLDALSGGRVIFTAGIGWSAGEFANLGYNFHNRGKRMDEALKVLRTLWRGGKSISFAGQFYNFQQMPFSPPPVQSGGPPLWVAGDSPAALRRAVYYADGWHPNSRSAEALTQALNSVQNLIGTRPFTVCMRMGLMFSPIPTEDQPLSGTSQDIIAALKKYQQAGLDYAILYIPSETQAERERALRAFSKEVAPELRE